MRILLIPLIVLAALALPAGPSRSVPDGVSIPEVAALRADRGPAPAPCADPGGPIDDSGEQDDDEDDDDDDPSAALDAGLAALRDLHRPHRPSRHDGRPAAVHPEPITPPPRA